MMTPWTQACFETSMSDMSHFLWRLESEDAVDVEEHSTAILSCVKHATKGILELMRMRGLSCVVHVLSLYVMLHAEHCLGPELSSSIVKLHMTYVEENGSYFISEFPCRCSFCRGKRLGEGD